MLIFHLLYHKHDLSHTSSGKNDSISAFSVNFFIYNRSLVGSIMRVEDVEILREACPNVDDFMERTWRHSSNLVDVCYTK